MRRLGTFDRGGWLANRFQMTSGLEEGVPTVRIHGWNVPGKRLRRRLFLHLAGKVFDGYAGSFGEPDLIHAHSALWAGLAARRLGERHGLPYVVTEHSSAFARGLLADWQKRDANEVFSAASEVLAVSEALANQLRGLASNPTVRVVPNVVDTDFFCLPPEERGRSGDFNVLVVGTLRRNKGVDLLLRAFAEVFEGEGDVELVVVGDGESRSELMELAGRLGIGAQVRFTGRLSRGGVRREMWKADVLVSASRVETFGIVLAEAMATGLPVVATRSGGPEEIVPEWGGWLVDPGHVHGLATALEHFRRAERRMRRRTSDIREHVVERFGSDAVIPRIVSVYRSALTSVDSPRSS